ncbi:plant UBX domain-containing protein 2 [Musa acuminata AAA Group]|uniref:plant UBX domain-containing protein 2 n=1 Tax=Musa acuminata AAA Group TaxID=214697 RepID=UPI0031DB77FE
MDDMKDKMKGLLKKVNNPFSSTSSSKFKGQGHVLGSGTPPSSSSSSSSSLSHPRPSNPPPRSLPSRPTPSPSSSSAEFDPFDPLISSGRQVKNGPSVPAPFACPVCTRPFPTEADVSAHLDVCLAHDASAAPDPAMADSSDVAARVSAFVSSGPPQGAVEVVLKLLGNVAREPQNEKFRRIRMGNPKIKEAVGARGGVELLESVGFRLGEEEGEVWATMEAPSEEQIAVIKEATTLLESWKSEGSVPVVVSDVKTQRSIEPKKIDRQVKVFFPVPESEAARIDLPDSFYNLSSTELKREADLRKKRLADSQLLIPKSYREKQAMAAKRKYKRAVVRVQFPDGVLLQGVFLPWEPTTALYEFVSSALKDPSLEFELLQPAVPKLRVVPFPKPGARATTLEEEDLVPSALVKFKPTETDSMVFTGLTNELLEASEPLNSTAALS